MASPTSSEKAINETAPIAIHTQTDIWHPLSAQAATSFPPGPLPNKAAAGGLAVVLLSDTHDHVGASAALGYASTVSVLLNRGDGRAAYDRRGERIF